jgi:Double zinc ribbon
VGNFTDQIGQGVAAFVDLPAVRFAVTAAGAYIVLVWLACAFWVFQDTRRRQRNVVAPYLTAGAIVLASPALFLLALFVYRIARPGETLSEARLRRLEDRLEDLDLQLVVACADCGAPIQEDWLICPSCRTRLAHLCIECGRSMRLDWSVCAWCAAELAHPALLDAPQVSAAETAEPAEPAEPVFQPQPEAVTA